MEADRNIVDRILVPHTQFGLAVKRIHQCLASVKGAAEPICLALIGESRTGKSRVQATVAQDYPSQRTKEGLVVPILRARTPSKPTVKGLAQLLLRVLGDPLWEKGTEIALTERLRTLLIGARTQMLMLDEFQHFYDKTSRKVIHHTADWLKILVDETRVSLLVAGLPPCMAVIKQNEQLAGRFQAPITMPRFDWNNDVHREEYFAILSAFNGELSKHLDMPDLASDEIAFRIYCGTGGLIGYVTKFLRQVVWNALDTSGRIVGLEQLSQAYKESILTEERSAVDPFQRGFAVESHVAALAKAALIGTAQEEPATPRLRRSKPAT